MFIKIKSGIERNFINVLRNSSEFDSKRVVHSPRAVGDLVQELAEENLSFCISNKHLHEFSGSFARRAMADVAFTDTADNYYIVDIKTHNTSTDFNMPNLTSVERLSRFYEDDKNNFAILLVSYSVTDETIQFDDVKFILIEHLSWNCLTIGALGWGQIQIANSNNIIESNSSRKEWMLQLCDALEIFYPKEIEKINGRIERFRKIRKYWESK